MLGSMTGGNEGCRLDEDESDTGFLGGPYKREGEGQGRERWEMLCCCSEDGGRGREPGMQCL